MTKHQTQLQQILLLENRLMLAGILGTAESFAVLGGSTVTNTGSSIVTGHLGVSPGSAVVGFPPGIVTPPGTIHATDAVAVQAQSDLTVAYNDLAGRASNFNLTGSNLGGLTLTPGVYTFSASAQLTGTLTLDAQGNPDAEFIFQIGSTLTTASNATVDVINGADSCSVFWQVGSSATLGTDTEFLGNILALTSITLDTNATILNGRALARNGAVTLDTNQVSIDGCGSIAWEKRTTDADPTLLAGATFEISPNPRTGVGTLVVVDGGPNDADGLANGTFQVNDVLMGTYTVTETVAPTGYEIDDDATRTVTVSPDDFQAVIGVQGVDDEGDTNESDFHNRERLGSIAWEKRDHFNAPQGGATFTISPDPTDGIGDLTIQDNGPGDANPAAGQIQVDNVPVGSYIITEAVAPPGFAIDDDPTRSVTVALNDLNQVIGVQGNDQPGNTDESDFHNRLGSVAWEKRATDLNPVLLAGATFEISPNPLTGVGTLIVVDGDPNDVDGLANGVLQVANVRLGTYTITETVAPAGFSLDDDPTRSIDVSSADLNAVVGVQGSDQPGNTDESDFHNVLITSIAWEKRATDSNPVLLGGATFQISPNPLTGMGTLTVVDGGPNDVDGVANGVLQVANVLLGTYTITETVAPAGFTLDDDPTRSITVSNLDPNAVIGVQGSDQPGNTNESDFHNVLITSIAWEKRTTDTNPVLLAGATFEISPNPLTGMGTLVVVDGGVNDVDGVANGVLQVANVLLGTYTITETVAPAGFALDDDVTRSVTVSNLDPNAVIGVQGSDQPGNTNESDFHNRLGSLAWEKRSTDTNPVLLAGATFEISPHPLTGMGTLTVVDGGPNDADGLANGVLQINNVLLGMYTITETIAPAGFAIDDVLSRSVTVSSLDLNAVIGVQGSDQPGNTNESDFHNRLGSLAWEKRATDANPVLLAGATFEISPSPLTGTGILTVVDGGANDVDGLANGVLQVNNVRLGIYTITETVAPAGFALDVDPARSVTVSSLDLNAVIGTQGSDQPGNSDESDFHNRLGSLAWEKRATDTNPVLLAGASFRISPDPRDGVGVLVVIDGGVSDADGLANGIFRIENVLLGTYTVTEIMAPAGFALDDDVTRLVTVSPGDLNAIIGIQGSDQPGNTDESDFHNILMTSIAWEKRATDTNPVLLAGATFEISPNPLTGMGTLTVVDGGANDVDGLANGVLQVGNVLLGTYTITETVAPAGFALDDDPTRSITVSNLDPNAVIGVQGSDQSGNTDESDFHNILITSIAWEKRATDTNSVLLAGATFEISPNPLTGMGTLVVVDGGVNDVDGVANGVLQVANVLLGTYTITETVAPAGFALDDDVTRSVTVSNLDPNAVIGVQGSNQPGNADESDFHNRLGSLAWEKRATDMDPMLLGGATFEISPNPLTGMGTLIVVDGGPNDVDGLVNGVLQVANVLLGTYTITETVAPVGYALDDDVTRTITVSSLDLNAVIGVQGSDQPGNINESDFHNRLGSLAWEKRATDTNPVLLAGATFEISPNPLTGMGTLIVVDGGANDADGLANGVLQVNNVRLGIYTITETVAPAGFTLDDDATRTVTVSSLDLNAVIGVQGNDQPGNTDESDFHNRLGSVAWEKRATDLNPVLLAGATFEISPNPLTGMGTLIVVDGGTNDVDGLANGVLQVNDVLLGTYTITETVAPTGFSLDDDPTRSITVSSINLNAVVGDQGSDQPGNTDESDFHNVLMTSIAWEKRATDTNPVLLAGATFEISPNPLTGMGTLTVVDGGPNDVDGLANGVLQVANVLLGTYTITETVAPAGFFLDDDPTRSITVSNLDPNAVIGVQGSDQPGNTDEADFHNILITSIAWEKRATDANPVLLAGASFRISPDPRDGVGVLVVIDGGANDVDGLANGVVQVANVLLGTYTITEIVSPAGFALDDDVTRSVTVSNLDPNAVIGVQGSDQPGNTDESDFHNRLGSLAWEKRSTDTNPVLLAGATFEISPNPLTGMGTLTVVDGGLNDADGLANGVLQINNVLLGMYTITETIAPAGFAIDDVPSRGVTVSSLDLNAVIGTQGSNQPGDTGESDFHNRLGSLAWEKRATDTNPVLLAGASFRISPDPRDGVGVLVVIDGGVSDADGQVNGIFRIENVLLGTYTVTEIMAPAGFVIDDDATRLVTVSAGDLNAIIGTQGSDQPGNTDESDFHNRLGGLAWEKRATDTNPVLLGGASFRISPDPRDGVGVLVVIDGGANDADGLANGILRINGVRLGTYTVTEIMAPAGFALDDDVTRLVTVSPGDLNAVIGTQGNDQPGNTDESDFHNRLGSVAWEKRATDTNPVLLAGASFRISPDPRDGVGVLVVIDGGVSDADGQVNGIFRIENVLLGTYTVTEILAPAGFVIDDDATRLVTVSAGDLNAIIGTQGSDQPGNTDESDFHNQRRRVIVIGAAKSLITPQLVTVLDEQSGAVLSQFAPYGNAFQGGVRVATGDLTGDGIDEIITAPGPSIVGQVRVYSQVGTFLTSFQPYGAIFNGGVQVAVADVDGDGLNDIITVPSWGPAEVKVFRNVLAGGAPTFNAALPFRDFLAFPASFIGGAVVAAADMGSTPLPNGPFDNTQRDQRAEIVVGSGPGMQTTVKVFDVRGLLVPTPSALTPAAESFTPFSTTTTTDQGGVSLSVARINADIIPDIVVGAGVNGGSLVDAWAWSNTTTATLSSLSANGVGFAAFTDASRTAPVEVAALDTDGNEIADAILAVQGPGGTTGQIREFQITSVTPLQVSPPSAVPGGFPGPYVIATIRNVSPDLPQIGNAPTRFYVVNDGGSNRTYEYSATGSTIENYALNTANTAPRGAVSTAAGDRVWVVDASRQVHVYNDSGSILGSWTAGTLASNATVEGIATNGTDVWIVDANSDRIFRYANAAGRLSGSQNAASSFALNGGNTNPKDFVTDGSSFWVVNDAAQDEVFKYSLTGALVGRWTITGGGGAPTGITLDPAAPSHLWIVDNNTDRVEQYNNAVGRTSGSQAASTSFALAAGNTNPQGIADPPRAARCTPVSVIQDAALLSLMGELDWLTPTSTRR